MNELVFLAPNNKEPFTRSDVIAECADVKHHAVQQMITAHMDDFKSFGKVAFEMRPLPGSRTGQNIKIYHLNEQQATLLMTYLRNTDVVRKFKMELVRQFFAKRQELADVKAVKTERHLSRASLTDAINALPDSPHKGMKYSQYTNLTYLVALGKTASQIRKERGAPKTATASDYMSAKELDAVAEAENRVAVLIGIGMDYHQIKAALTKRHSLSA